MSRLPRSDCRAPAQPPRAARRLAEAGLSEAAIAIEGRTPTARSPGTVLFLAVRGRAGASALGRRGLPAREVGRRRQPTPCSHGWASGSDVDEHLADQIVPFLALAGEPSSFTCPRVSRHLETVAWVVEQFLPVDVRLEVGRPRSASSRS